MEPFEIQILDREKWQNYMLDFAYTSDSYYNVAINQTPEGFSASFIKRPFAEPFVNPNTTFDKLYQPHWGGATAYGIVENGALIAAIETWAEEWSNRLRVTELWVDKTYHRHGAYECGQRAGKAPKAPRHYPGNPVLQHKRHRLLSFSRVHADRFRCLLLRQPRPGSA